MGEGRSLDMGKNRVYVSVSATDKTPSEGKELERCNVNSGARGAKKLDCLNGATSEAMKIFHH